MSNVSRAELLELIREHNKTQEKLAAYERVVQAARLAVAAHSHTEQQAALIGLESALDDLDAKETL